MRRQINENLKRWIRNRAEEKFADDIALILCYGSAVNGTANEMSDLDCYFIPANDNAYDFCLDFILAGVGYDIFPMTWERVEGLAALNESLLPCLGDVEILYCRSEEDKVRFLSLQQKLKENLADKTYCREAAKKRLLEGWNLYCSVPTPWEGMDRSFLGGTAQLLAEGVILSQGDYFHYGAKRQVEELSALPRLPENFLEDYKAVAFSKTVEEAKEHALHLLENTACFLGETLPQKINVEVPPRREKGTVWADVAQWYEEVSSTFNKIEVCCETGNPVLGFFTAATLQRELFWLHLEQSLPYYGLLDGLSAADLPELLKRARAIEKELVASILQGGAVIRKFESFGEFEAAKL